MSNEERADLPCWTITVAEKLQSLENRLPLSSLIRLVAGSSSPLYEQIRWQSVDKVWDYYTQKPTELPIAEADPDAHSLTSLVPRLKQSAVIVEAGRRLPAARDMLARDYGAARVSIAYTYKDRTHVGHLPGEITRVKTDRPNLYRAALRSGRSEFGAALGVWVTDEQAFVPSPDSIIVENNFPIEALTRLRYPNISLF